MFQNYGLYVNEWNHFLALGQIHHYKTGDVIYMQGEKKTGLVFLKKGKIKNCVYFKSGAEKIVCILEGPAITGETAVIDDGSSIVSAEALSDAEVVIVPAEVAKEFVMENPKAMLMLFEIHAEKIRSVQFQAESVVLNIHQKLARMLINFHSYGIFSHDSDKPLLSVTHEQLAAFLGTTRPKITSALNEFEQSGLIRKNRGNIEIIKADELKKIYE